MEARHAVTAPAPTAEALLTPTGEPRWDDIDFDLPCPRCGYELRLLTRPRCPECGLTFAWSEVLAKRLGHRAHNWLFEAQWRRRPLRSFLTTLWRCLRPPSFWRAIPLAEPVRMTPLLVVALAGLLAPTLLSEVAFLSLGRLLRFAAEYAPTSWRLWNLGESLTLTAVDCLRYPMQATLGAQLVALGAVTGTTLVLAGLRQTLARCRVRPLQMLRVACYSVLASGVLAGLVFTMLIATTTWRELLANPATFSISMSDNPSALLVVPLALVWMGIGWACYLRLPRAWLVIPIAGLVGGLATLAVFALCITAMRA